jgi:hypothetical protein
MLKAEERMVIAVLRKHVDGREVARSHAGAD